MTNDARLAEIRKRLAAWRNKEGVAGGDLYDDIAYLLERLEVLAAALEGVINYAYDGGISTGLAEHWIQIAAKEQEGK